MRAERKDPWEGYLMSKHIIVDQKTVLLKCWREHCCGLETKANTDKVSRTKILTQRSLEMANSVTLCQLLEKRNVFLSDLEAAAINFSVTYICGMFGEIARSSIAKRKKNERREREAWRESTGWLMAAPAGARKFYVERSWLFSDRLFLASRNWMFHRISH